MSVVRIFVTGLVP